MAAVRQKTYEGGLRLVAGAFNRYGTRWNPQLAANLSPDQYTKLQAAITCIQALLAILTPPAPGN
jgi:hypothetical protein